MKLDDLTIKEAREIASLFGGQNRLKRDYGYAVLVADRGFVYVGNVIVDGDFALITNSKNIRYWGTKNGLGELVLNGPTKETKLDDNGNLDVPMRAVISIHKTDKNLWVK